MRQNQLRPSLTPNGLTVEQIEIGLDKIVAVARSPSRTASCSSYGSTSTQVHSRYQLSLADLTAHGHAVEIKVVVRAFAAGGRSAPR